jgi:hypothetical protein
MGDDDDGQSGVRQAFIAHESRMIRNGYVSRRAALGGIGAAAVATALPRAAWAEAGRSWYLSAAGSDSADGTSPGTAWASIARLLAQPIAPGDRILFRRGDTFAGHLGFAAAPRSAGDPPVLLTGYGNGPRPIIQGYKTIPAAAWIAAGPGLWKVAINAPSLLGRASTNGADGANIGFLRVDGRIHGDKKFALADLARDWQFYSDEAQWLYVRLSSNPGRAAREIMAAPHRHCSARSGVTLRGLDIVGYGGHGVQGSLDDVTVEDCVIREIGGSRLTKTTRYGNGVQCWAGSSNVTVRGNTIQDVYDVACTMQGKYSGAPESGWHDILFANNRITRCNQAMEVWAQYGGSGPPPGVTPFRNTAFVDNDISRIGYGWSADVRPDQLTKSPILFYNVDVPSLDFRIAGNRIRDFAGALIYTPKGTSGLPRGVRFDDNDIAFSRSDQPIHAQMPFRAGDWKRFVRQSGIGLDSPVSVGR